MRALVLTLSALVAPAQQEAPAADPHAACAATGWVPREILERPVALRTGIGNARERVTTASKEAQAFYDQGLDYLHGYVWIEAARSFHQALRIDPGIAMAHVGLSRVFSGLDDPEAARKAVARARELAADASPRERRRVALRELQLEAMAELGDTQKHLRYKKALDEALAAEIEAPELWLLRGNAEEPTAAGRGQRGGVASAAFYLQALQAAPDNAAAHHYLTHSYETIGQIPRALVHGEAYARLAPAIPHAHHMWGHDLRRVGRIDDAIVAFLETDALEKAYYAAENVPAGLDWHHGHNLDLLATAYQHKGRMKQAEEAMREAAALPAVTEYLEFNQKQMPVFLLSRGRFEEALGAARRLAEGSWAASRAVGHVLAGHALLALGRSAAAESELAAAERELLGVAPVVAGLSVSRSAVQPYVDALRGEILLRSGRTAEGRRLLEEVQGTLRAALGPDAWIQALFRLESIARVAQSVGDWELAEHTAGQMLEHDPSYGGSHLALAAVAAHKGDRALAERELLAAESCWRDADPDLPELALVRARKADPGR